MQYSKEQALEQIDINGRDFSDLSDAVWDNPELRFDEYKSAELICRSLKKYGFEVEQGLAGMATAFTGTYGTGEPVIGLLGEFDALSGLSQEADTTSRCEITAGGNGHGCGHNLLGAGSLAAAVAVKSYLEENKLPGTVIYFGCPGEEGGSGKAFMARAGIFDRLDAAITWHPGDTNITSVLSTLANYQILYQFHGIASHAAADPERGRSALDALELMNTGVQYLREHIIQSARIHYAITNTGGASPNVVQPYAEALYLIRAPKMPQVQEIYERVNRIAQGAALMTDTRMEMQFIKACANVIPNRTLSQVLQDNLVAQPFHVDDEDNRAARAIIETFETDSNDSSLERIGGMYYSEEKKEALECNKGLPIYCHPLPLPDFEVCMSGSSDVGDCSWNTPTAQISAATQAAGTPAHSWQAVAQGKSAHAHKAMLYAARVMGGAVIDLFDHPELLAAARKELDKRLNGHPYESAIPEDVTPQPASKV